MTNKLLLTTALVSAAFAFSANAWADAINYDKDHAIPTEELGHNKGDGSDRINIKGEDVELEGDEAVLGSFVTLKEKAKFKSEEGKTKKLIVRGYLTADANAQADLSAIDLQIEKGIFDRGEGSTSEEGELVLGTAAEGDIIKLGNVKMTEGTNIYLYNESAKASDDYKLSIAEDKTLTFDGNNKIYGGVGDPESENEGVDGAKLTFEGAGSVENNGVLTATDVVLNANTTVTNNDTIIAKEVAVAAGKTLDNRKTIKAKVSGDGTVKMTSGAIIDGDVSMSNGALEFDGDNKLSEAVTGSVNIKDIKVNSGTFIYDADEFGDKRNVTLAEGGTITVGTDKDHTAGLDLGTNTVKNVTLNEGSSLTIGVGKDGSGSVETKLEAKGDNNLNLFIADDADLEKLNLGQGVADALSAEDSKLNFDAADNFVYDIEVDEDTGKVTATKNSASEIAANVAKKIGSTGLAGVAGAYAGATGLEEGSIAAAIHEQMNLAAQTGDVATIENLSEDIAPVLAPVVQTVETNQLAHAYGAVSSQLSANSIDTASAGVSSGDGMFEKAVIWVKGLFNKSTVDDMSDAKGFDVETKGVAFGAHNEVADNVKVGVAYAYGDTEIDGHHRDIDVDSHTFMLYGEYKPSNWYVNGIASYGFSKYKEHKNSMVGRINGKYDVNVFGLQAMTGYETLVGSVNVTPEIGLRYARLDQETYTDSANQRIRAKDQDILTAIADVKASKEVAFDNGISLRPEARLGVTYDLMDGDNSAVVNVGSSSYSIEGESLERFGVEAGLGLTASLNESWDVSAGYEGRFRKDFEDHAGILSAKYKF